MNPLMLGIVAVVGIAIIMNLNKKDPDLVLNDSPERSYPWPAFIVSGQAGVVPYAGFFGGGGETIEERPLLPY